MRLRGIALAAIAGALLTGCNEPRLWEKKFERASVAGSRGWTGGDAALSVALPGEGDRSLWVFGDSLITGWDPTTGERLASPLVSDFVFGTTVAIQRGTRQPRAASVRFWARLGDEPVDITDGAFDSYSAFFDHDVVGLDAVPGAYLWPSSALCFYCDAPPSSDDSLLLSFTEWKPCDPTTAGLECVALCDVTGTPPEDPAGCTLGVEFLDDVVSRIGNPGSPHTEWRGASSRVGGGVHWGRAFLEIGPWVAIYGHLERPDASRRDLVVAISREGDVLDPEAWWYWTQAGWLRGSTPGADQLAVVAEDVGAFLSVHQITRRGFSRYLLVHAHPTRDHYIYVRSSDRWNAWPAPDTTTPRLDLVAGDDSLRAAAYWEFLTGDCAASDAPDGVPDLRGCGRSYHGLAHPHISLRDEHGIASLYFGYIVPYGRARPGLTHGDYYRPKFGSILLDGLEPWCLAAGVSCWQGIASRFEEQHLAEGEEWTQGFDVSLASGFRATLVGGSGDPDLYVGFKGPPTTTSFDCRSAVPGWFEECQSSVPEGATSAWVMVRGRTAATFMLRTEHEGS